MPDKDIEVKFYGMIPSITRAVTVTGPAPRAMFEGYKSQADRFGTLQCLEGVLLEITARVVGPDEESHVRLTMQAKPLLNRAEQEVGLNEICTRPKRKSERKAAQKPSPN